MIRVISSILPMALLILAAACGNSDTPVPTATVGLTPTPTTTPTEDDSTNQIAGPVVIGEFPTSSFDCSGRYLGYIPGLGGLFFGPNTDETRVSVFLTDPDNQEAIREVACLWLERDLVRVLKADYTLSQLRGWYRELGQTTSSGAFDRGVRSSGLDEKTNRIVYKFSPVRGIREDFDAIVVASGVPKNAAVLKSGCTTLEGEYKFSPPTAAVPAESLLENLFVELIVPDTVAYGADLPLVIEITNTGSETLDLEIGAGEEYGYAGAFDFWIAPGESKILWHWNCGKAYPAILGLKSLAPGEKIAMQGTWEQIDYNSEPVAPGNYLVNGIAKLGLQGERDPSNRKGGFILAAIPVTVLP